MSQLMNSARWCSFWGYKVTKATGWDQSTPEAFKKSWEEPITQEEFFKRIEASDSEVA